MCNIHKIILSTTLIASLAHSNKLSKYGEFTINSNILDRGESLNQDNASINGMIGFKFNEFKLEFSALGVTEAVEFDTTISYNGLLNKLKYSISYLTISESSLVQESDFKSNIGTEGSISLEYPIDNFNIGIDFIRDLKYSEFNIISPKISTSIGNFDIEFLYGVVNNRSEKDFYYNHIALSTPCQLSSGSWSFEYAKRESQDELYSISHTIEF